MTSRRCWAGVPALYTSTFGSTYVCLLCWGCLGPPLSKCSSNTPPTWHGTRKRYSSAWFSFQQRIFASYRVLQIISGSQLAAVSRKHFLPGDREIPQLSRLGSGSSGSAHPIRHDACPSNPGPHSSEEQVQEDLQRCRDGPVQRRQQLWHDGTGAKKRGRWCAFLKLRGDVTEVWGLPYPQVQLDKYKRYKPSPIQSVCTHGFAEVNNLSCNISHRHLPVVCVCIYLYLCVLLSSVHACIIITQWWWWMFPHNLRAILETQCFFLCLLKILVNLP